MEKPVNNIIKKIYVVTDCSKTYYKIKNRFQTEEQQEQQDKKDKKDNQDSDQLQVEQHRSVDIKSFSEDKIREVSTSVCNKLCSLDMIKRWLTHTKLWEKISKRGEDRVLVLEDTADLPLSSFESMLQEYWKEVPDRWDMIYLGCQGSCDRSSLKDAVYKVCYNKTNNDVYKNGSKMVMVNEPAFPLGLYGYMLSKTGAKKLVNINSLKKVNFNLDRELASKTVGNRNFKAYSFVPPLITNKDPHKKTNNRKILKPITKEIPVSKSDTVNDMLQTTVCDIRCLGVEITVFSLIILLTSLLVGYFGNRQLVTVYLATVTFLQLAELSYTKSDRKKKVTVMFELVMFVLVGVYVGEMIKQKVKR